MAEADRERLVEFLNNLRAFVYEVLDEYAEIFGKAGDQGRLTWDGLEANHAALVAVLQGEKTSDWPGPGERPTYDVGTLDRELAERGLTDTPLAFKLDGFYRARDQWLEWQKRPPTVEKRSWGRRVAERVLRIPALPGPVRKTLGVAKRALEWGDVGLITLASFVQVGEPIKEAKEGVEALVGDSLDLSDRQLERQAGDVVAR